MPSAPKQKRSTRSRPAGPAAKRSAQLSLTAFAPEAESGIDGDLLPESRVEDLLLPIVEDVHARIWIIDAIDQAAKERKGVAVLGEKGVGKSIGIAEAIRDFEAGEDQKEAGQRRAVFRIQSPQANDRVNVIAAIHHAITGDHLETRENGRRIPEDVLFAELVADMLNANVAALIFDEAEYLSDTALDVIRGIISRAESDSKNRFVGRHYRPAGVGVVLVGTTQLKSRLDVTGEAGHRWLRAQRVGMLSPARAALVYRKFLPCLEHHAREISDEAWSQFVHVNFCPRSVPIRFVENHVREYVRRIGNYNPAIRSVVEVPYMEEVLIQVWQDGYLQWVHDARA